MGGFPSRNPPFFVSERGFGIWNLVFLWCLVFGVWSFGQVPWRCEFSNAAGADPG